MSRTLRPPAVVAMVGLISTGCGSDAPSAETGTAGSSATGADKKATSRARGGEARRVHAENGVSDFPDPTAAVGFV